MSHLDDDDRTFVRHFRGMALTMAGFKGEAENWEMLRGVDCKVSLSLAAAIRLADLALRSLDKDAYDRRIKVGVDDSGKVLSYERQSPEPADDGQREAPAPAAQADGARR